VTFNNNSASEFGGGMFVGSSVQTLTTLTNVTFNDNTSAQFGGGIANAGFSDLNLTNVTFSDNTAGTNGAGIFNGEVNFIESGGTLCLVNATFHSNIANSHGGAVYNETGAVNIRNSILYGNGEEEIHGTANVTYSIVQGGYTGSGNLDAEPLLGSLQNNGGFTQTLALLPGSPAIDAGNDTFCPATDQRGVTRPQGSHCDIGAYEYEETTESEPTHPYLKSQALHPSSFITQSGTTDGASSNLNQLNQTGMNDDPAAYVTFQALDAPYRGYQSFTLPEGTQAKLISTMLLQMNVKAPASSTQVWTWSIYDPTSNMWINIGDSAGLEADQWQELVFRIRQPWRYISSGNEIRIQLTSRNTDGDLKIDYAALHVTYLSLPVTPTPIAPLVPSNRPGISSVPMQISGR